MGRDDPHFRLRIPEDLKGKIEEAAALNQRSITAEIVARLRQSLGSANANAEVGPARERVKRAMDELRDALGELELAETLE